VTIARRAGNRWWIGSLSALNAHNQTVPLGFLARGRTYDMQLVRDDGSGRLTVEHRVVESTSRPSVRTERYGGFAAELSPRR
jgi:alpha-glucosidase